ncbi:MAG: hypothetical protein ISR64_11305 [Deltaproteobacteria bacterium]|nr:hypothetical protein [Deltaproteobacteria bacterium]
MKSKEGKSAKTARGGKQRTRGARPTGSLEQRAARILEDLHALGRSVLRSEGIASGSELPVGEVTIPISVRLGRAQDDAPDRTDAKRLLRKLRSRVGEAARGVGTFRQGRVYCFQCNSPDCNHSAPNEPDETFSGYSATGKPEWRSLVNLCIEKGDGRADRLYGSPPEIIAVLQEARELTGELLPGFGRGDRSYNVLGQVVLGLVPTDLSFNRKDGPRTAVTFQLIETRSQGAGRRLRLNLLGMSIDHITRAAAKSGPRGPAESMRRTIQVVRDRLVGHGRKAAGEERRGYRASLDKDVRPLLSRLRTDLERIFRSEKRRTRHAEDRHADGKRPTGMAVKDARKAADEKFLHDAEKDTIVVLGPKGRTHVFSRTGKLVTSMVVKPGELERRFNKTRWRPALPKLLAELREKIRQ